jgi:hypothetical protein
MVGSMGLLAASGAKSTVTDILANMAASADVLALAKIEVEMASIPEGKWVLDRGRGASRRLRANLFLSSSSTPPRLLYHVVLK